MMTREQVAQQLHDMCQQEVYLQEQADRLLEQLTMTRGAVQVLQHLLDAWEGEAEVSPSTNGAAQKESHSASD